MLTFLVSLKCRDVTTVKRYHFRRNFFLSKNLESKKKKQALTSFYYVNREIWLDSSKKLISIDQSRFYIFSVRIQKDLT